MKEIKDQLKENNAAADPEDRLSEEEIKDRAFLIWRDQVNDTHNAWVVDHIINRLGSELTDPNNNIVLTALVSHPVSPLYNAIMDTLVGKLKADWRLKDGKVEVFRIGPDGKEEVLESFDSLKDLYAEYEGVKINLENATISITKKGGKEKIVLTATVDGKTLSKEYDSITDLLKEANTGEVDFAGVKVSSRQGTLTFYGAEKDGKLFIAKRGEGRLFRDLSGKLSFKRINWVADIFTAMGFAIFDTWKEPVYGKLYTDLSKVTLTWDKEKNAWKWTDSEGGEHLVYDMTAEESQQFGNDKNTELTMWVYVDEKGNEVLARLTHGGLQLDPTTGKPKAFIAKSDKKIYTIAGVVEGQVTEDGYFVGVDAEGNTVMIKLTKEEIEQWVDLKTGKVILAFYFDKNGRKIYARLAEGSLILDPTTVRAKAFLAKKDKEGKDIITGYRLVSAELNSQGIVADLLGYGQQGRRAYVEDFARNQVLFKLMEEDLETAALKVTDEKGGTLYYAMYDYSAGVWFLIQTDGGERMEPDFGGDMELARIKSGANVLTLEGESDGKTLKAVRPMGPDFSQGWNIEAVQYEGDKVVNKVIIDEFRTSKNPSLAGLLYKKGLRTFGNLGAEVWEAAQSGDPRALEYLFAKIDAAGDVPQEVKEAAFRGDPRAIEYLIGKVEALGKLPEGVREAALSGDPRAIEYLIGKVNAAGDLSQKVKEAALKGDDKALELVARALSKIEEEKLVLPLAGRLLQHKDINGKVTRIAIQGKEDMTPEQRKLAELIENVFNGLLAKGEGINVFDEGVASFNPETNELTILLNGKKDKQKQIIANLFSPEEYQISFKRQEGRLETTTKENSFVDVLMGMPGEYKAALGIIFNNTAGDG